MLRIWRDLRQRQVTETLEAVSIWPTRVRVRQ